MREIGWVELALRECVCVCVVGFGLYIYIYIYIYNIRGDDKIPSYSLPPSSLIMEETGKES